MIVGRRIGNPDFRRRVSFGAVGRKIGNPDLVRRVGNPDFVPHGGFAPHLVGNPDLRVFVGNPDFRIGYGQVEDIHCPAGTTVNGDAQGNVWCDDGKGNKVPATFTPALDTSAPATAPSGIGVVGWGFIVAGAMLLGAVVIRPRKGGR